MSFQTNLSNPSNFSIIEQGRSTVRLVTDSKTLKKYAVKFVSLQNDSLKKESYLLKKFNHPNIVKLIDSGILVKENYLVTEYMDYGDLFNFVTQNHERIYTTNFIRDKKNYEKFWRTIFIQGLEALVHMKSFNLAHLDIKPENFLINSEFEVKLIDFEFAFHVENIKDNSSQCSKCCGSRSYFCPEIKEKKFPYDPFKADVFSFGITMLNLMTGMDIFGALNPFEKFNEQYIAMRSDKFEDFWKNLNFFGFSSEFKELVEKMLNYDKKVRSSLEEVKEDPWFQKEVFSKEEIKMFFNLINDQNERKKKEF